MEAQNLFDQKLKNGLGLVLAVLMLITLGQPAHAQTPADAADIAATMTEYDSVRVVVVLRTPVTGPAAGSTVALQAQAVDQAQDTILASITDTKFKLVQEFEILPGMVIEVDAQGLETLLNHPDVIAVALDLPIQTALTESTTRIGADVVWEQWGITGEGVNVAVLDTGIDPTHPDLADNLVAQKCFGHGTCPPSFSNQSDSAQDGNGHGTHISGIITSRGETGPRGVAPDAGIVAVRIMDDNGSGFTSDVIAGIDWILAHQDQLQVKVINLSLGGGAYSGVCDSADANTQLYAQAVQSARAAGITIFAAAGNHGLSGQIMAPACVSGVVAVGATYDTALGEARFGTCTDTNIRPDQVACVSNSSTELDLLAPGILINSTALGGGQRTESGTSMSTAHAAGVAALLLQANPDLTPDEIEAVLKETGLPVTDPRNGRVTARIDALAAVERVSDQKEATIWGSVLLQGRADHSGVQIVLHDGACAPDVASAASVTTNPAGQFELAALPASQTERCLQVIHSGYLVGQHSAPEGNVGVITLPGGDTNGDGLIDIFDMTFISSHYNGQDVQADINADGKVDILDLVIAAGNYDRQGPVTNWQ